MRYNPYTRHFWDILIILLVVYVENIPSCAAISSQDLNLDWLMLVLVGLVFMFISRLNKTAKWDLAALILGHLLLFTICVRRKRTIQACHLLHNTYVYPKIMSWNLYGCTLVFLYQWNRPNDIYVPSYMTFHYFLLYMYVENILYQYIVLNFCRKSNFSVYLHIVHGGIGIRYPYWALLGNIDDLASCVRRKHTNWGSYLLPGLQKFKNLKLSLIYLRSSTTR